MNQDVASSEEIIFHGRAAVQLYDRVKALDEVIAEHRQRRAIYVRGVAHEVQRLKCADRQTEARALFEQSLTRGDAMRDDILTLQAMRRGYATDADREAATFQRLTAATQG